MRGPHRRDGTDPVGGPTPCHAGSLGGLAFCQHCREYPDNSRFFEESARRDVGAGLAPGLSMSSSKPKVGSSRGSIVVVGGSGGMSDRYRAIAEERGLELRHFENRVPNGTRKILGKVAAVIIMVGMVSHSLRDQVKGLVSDDAPVVYLRSASVSALRNAVSSLET